MAVRKSPVCRGTPPKVYEIPSLPIENRVYIALKCDSNVVLEVSIIGRQGLTIDVSRWVLPPLVRISCRCQRFANRPAFSAENRFAIRSQYIGTESAKFALDTFSPLWRRRGHPLV